MNNEPMITALGVPTRLGFETVMMNADASVVKLIGFSNDRVEI